MQLFGAGQRVDFVQVEGDHVSKSVLNIAIWIISITYLFFIASKKISTKIYPSYFGGLCLMQAQGAHISLEGIDIREWAVPVCLRPVVCPVSPLMSVNSHLLVPNLCCSTCCLGSSLLGFAG